MKKNIDQWTSRGGIAIHHTSAADTIQKLAKIMGGNKLTEMPHIELGEDVVIDLCVEKYPIPDSLKQKIMHAYNTKGVSAYAEKYDKYILLNSHGLKVIPGPTDIELPSYWELYAVKHIN